MNDMSNPAVDATATAAANDRVSVRRPGPSKKAWTADRPEIRWVPISEHAFQAALKVRAQVQRQVRMRPDISVVVAAMLIHASGSDNVTDAVARYGLELYEKTKAARANERAPASVAADQTAVPP